MNAGCVKSKLDPALLFIFLSHDSLQGLIACRVDDFSHAGTDLFNQVVIDGAIGNRFVAASKERPSFKYINDNIKQNNDGCIMLDTSDYVSDLEVVSVSMDRKNFSTMDLNPEEREIPC